MCYPAGSFWQTTGFVTLHLGDAGASHWGAFYDDEARKKEGAAAGVGDPL